MGQTDSQEPEFQSGIVITPGLLARLEGKPRRKQKLLPQTGISLRQLSPATEGEVVGLIQRDKELKSAHERSKIAGGLLLKAEAEELEKVNQYADSLLQKEYRIPSREPPCELQHNEVLRCYEAHTQEPLVCSPLVDAYVACAKRARQHAARASQAA